MKKLLSVFTVSLLSFSTMAVEFFTPEPVFIAKVEKLVGSNAQNIKYFKADYGLTGIGVVTPKYKKMVFYTNDSADYIVSGVLIDTQTVENMTLKYSQDLDVDLTGITSDLEGLNHITQGNGEDVIYAVVDVNCGYCHQLWSEIQSIYKANPTANLTVHWVPVGFLGEDSLNKAKSIASIEDNKSALDMLTKGMNRESLSSTPADKLRGQERLKVNSNFMQKNSFGGVPLVVSNIDGKWDISTGNPGKTFFNALKLKNKPTPILVSNDLAE